MSVLVYRLTCLTNMHMGSGDNNYNIIDLEVEKDPVLGEPTMNASGVKGALRDYCSKQAGADKKSGTITFIFGSEGSGDQQGAYHFFAGDMLARPVRVVNGEPSYLLAVSHEQIDYILKKINAFVPDSKSAAEWSGKWKSWHEQRGNTILSPTGVKEVEGQNRVTKISDDSMGTFLKDLIKKLLGTDQWVLLPAEKLRDIELPVVAHNVLEDGISRNLWYEQLVPHESVFILMIEKPEHDTQFEDLVHDGSVVQFGAGATTGNGYTRLEMINLEA